MVGKALSLESDHTLTIADVLAWEQQHGEVTAGSVVLLYTGWQHKWSNSSAFFNRDADTKALSNESE